MRRAVHLAVTAAMFASLAPLSQGQDSNTILQKLKAQFKLTQLTADRNDIVTAGSVVVLQKDRLTMYALNNPIPPQSTYKKGRISRNIGSSIFGDMVNRGTDPDAGAITQRVFVNGEKFWVIGISASNDGVIFRFYSDAINDIRYWGELKFQFPKGSVPPARDFLNLVAEVITVEPDDNSANNSQQPAQNKSDAPAPAETPAPAPKTIAVGQTRDEVVGTFGQPEKIVKLATKEILYYPDMRVTFVGGKVSDVTVK